MSLGLLDRKSEVANSCESIVTDVIKVTTLIANACLVGKSGARDGEWVLVDTGFSNSEDTILKKSQEHFGDSKPAGIILTHGHFDHVGSVKELADYWKVSVYAHELEMPFLTGKEDYPPADPSVGGGLMAAASPLYPRKSIDIGNIVKALPADGSIPIMPEWRWIHTPGHTPGHISLFREKDRVLIAGDAFTTVKQESALAVLMQEKEVNGPPSYFTIDWHQARQSVKVLESLKPSFVITGHGKPMCGEELSRQLKELAEEFNEIAVPEQGKYVD
jgi:glyoxylase-like metal-dependent hydrolase (beta-lactamase superfamily II)